jgi:hypothetical protein
MNKILYIFAVLSLAFFASCASVSYPAQAAIPADIAGTVHAGDPVIPAENALMDDLGIVWVRNDFYWDQVEPKQGEWNFSRYDKMVEENKKSGRKILAILSFDNNWLYKNGRRRDYISPKNLPLYINYVETVVTRYKGKVDAWEIWNEPNVPIRFWNGPAKDFFALSKAAAQKIKEVDPNAYVVAGAFFRSPSLFIKGMWKAGAMENVDALSLHPYSGTPNSMIRLYASFERLVRRLGFSGEIWVTEIGYPVAGYYPMTIKERMLGDYIIKTFCLLAAKGARTIFWYQLSESYIKENTPARFNSERFFGLSYKDFELRDGAESFSRIVKAIAGSEYLAAMPDSAGPKTAAKPGVTAFYFKRPSGEILCVSLKKNKPAEITTVSRQL